jgi:hypothetical protein
MVSAVTILGCGVRLHAAPGLHGAVESRLGGADQLLLSPVATVSAGDPDQEPPTQVGAVDLLVQRRGDGVSISIDRREDNIEILTVK